MSWGGLNFRRAPSHAANDGRYTGGVDVAALMRALDWSSTPVGRPELWPPALREAVDILSMSRLPMWLGWGPGLTFFCNQAYANLTLGSGHAPAPGRPLRDVAPELWPHVAPSIERVLSTGNPGSSEGLLMLSERGVQHEERYITFSYSPLLDDAGHASGVLCIAADETQRVLADRRLSQLHQLALQLARADENATALAGIEPALAQNARDLPFTLTIARGPGFRAGECLAVTGFRRDHPALCAGRKGDFGLDPSIWPIEQVLREGKLQVLDLPRDIAWPPGPWDEPPTQALVAPITGAGQTETLGVFVAGLNRFRPLDEAYLSFVRQIAEQLATRLAPLADGPILRRARAAAAGSDPPAAVPLPARAPGRILIVSSDPELCLLLRQILGQRWPVAASTDEIQALTLARTWRPHLIVTDGRKAEHPASEWLARLRADAALCNIPAIVLCARLQDEAPTPNGDRGLDDFLVVPFFQWELLARASTRLKFQRLTQRLADQRAAMANLIEQAPLPIVVVRGKELILEVANAPAVAASGGRAALGRPLLEVVPELEGQGVRELFERILASGEPFVGREIPIRINARGVLVETFWTCILAPVRGDSGQFECVVAICSDVTEQVRARRRLESLAQEAERDNRTKDEFLAMLGHELRNPLAPMLIALQLLRLRGGASREQDVLERQVGHLSRLVDDLLDVSRITRGKIELHREPSELSELVSRAVEMVSPLLEKSQKQLDLQMAPAGLAVNVDVDRMAQVVSNLLTNAAKYSERGSRISVRGSAEGGWVRLSVKDEGIGIRPDMLDRVFDAFVQQPQTLDRSRGGLGLGLAIVRGLVEMHGGRVHAESAGIGRGSEFIVELPALSDPPAPVSAPPSAAESVPARSARAKRILVVDDNEDAASMLQHGLETMGYEVRVAHDGPSALRVSAAFQPDVALLDLGLPVMDGYELAQRLRDQAAAWDRPRLKLVAMTGYSQDTDRERSARAGFAQHLVKPLDLGSIERAIEDRSAADRASG